MAARVGRKIWREILRPIRQLSATDYVADRPYLTGNGASVEGFHPQQATVEAEAIPFVQRLVRKSREFPGPIVEIGTLLGITTTNMALAKAPSQKIITVDLYCWNPWGLTPMYTRR
jgi:hypothetical protein